MVCRNEAGARRNEGTIEMYLQCVGTLGKRSRKKCMNRVVDLLTDRRIACGLTLASKKRVMESVSGLLSEGVQNLSAGMVFDSLVARERLGSTGLGYGVALPHGRISAIRSARGAFVQLKQSVDFDAADHQPVDLVFALLVPTEATEEHLSILASLAELFSDADFRLQLRQATSAEQMRQLIATWDPTPKTSRNVSAR